MDGDSLELSRKSRKRMENGGKRSIKELRREIMNSCEFVKVTCLSLCAREILLSV